MIDKEKKERVEIELPGIGKVTVEQHKMTPEELEESKCQSEVSQKLLGNIKISGRWWELWEREETKEFFAELKCEETVKVAIEELKGVFTEEWFKLSEENHPIKFWLLNTPSLYSLGDIIPLGSAIKILGGTNSLHPNALGDLRSKHGFRSRAYELEVLAFLKVQNPSIVLEHELPISKSSKKPDARVDNTYFEIKDLSISKRETETHEILKEITDAVSQKFKEYQGTVGYVVDLGNPRDLNELSEAIEIAKDLINTIEVKAGVQSTVKDRVKIEIKVVFSDIKACFGNVTNYGRPEIWEFFRITKRLKESALKNPGDLPMIVVIRPSLPLIAFADEDRRRVLEITLFQQACSWEPKVKSVKELWVDLTLIDAEEVEKMVSNLVSSLLHVFIKLTNPFFEMGSS